MARWIYATARALGQDFKIKARQGIRWSGTLVVATGLLSVAWLWLKIPYGFPFGFTGFVLTSISHLVAVWIVDRGGPKPFCPTCQVPLNVHKHKCGVCNRTYSTS